VSGERQQLGPTASWLAHVGLVCALVLGSYLLFTRATAASPEASPSPAPTAQPSEVEGLAASTQVRPEAAQAESAAAPVLSGPAEPLVEVAGGALAQEALDGETEADPEPLAFDEAHTDEPSPAVSPARLLLTLGPPPGDGYRWPASGLHPREVASLPILMYHHVRDLPPNISDPFLRDLTVAASIFRQQLDYLATNHVQTIALDDLMANLQTGQALPPRSVVLTFDDGYDDNYLYAYPLLRERGMKATFFIITNLVARPGYMTWEQLREMELNGMSIESHTIDHLDLSIISVADLNWQLAESRRVLELNLLRPVRFLAYPSGRFSPRVLTAMRANGYEAAVTTNYGLRQSRTAPFELTRVRVKGADTLASLAAKLVPRGWPVLGSFGR
jgi:peptidoglycan/xylan/chitin deacetylase (PgdA/CDA1 family)